jgi:diadenylate cyclase
MLDFLKRRVFQNFGLKLFSLLLAIGLWLVVARDTPDEVALNVPIEFHNIPDKLEINSEEIPVAQVRVRGPHRLIGALRPEEVHVQVDLTDAKPGERTFDLRASHIRQPRELEAVQVVPSQLHLNFDVRMTKQIQVLPRVTGNFATGLRLARVTVTPETVTVSGPQSRVASLVSASTDPVDASGVVTSQTFTTNVYVSDPLIQVVRPAPVRVTVIMERVPAATGGN